MTITNPIRSLALTVHFKNPSFGMKKHEVLSRASAFLLSVDPPNPEIKEKPPSSPYDHLGKSAEDIDERDRKRNYKYEPAGGPRRHAKDLGWLEFCPTAFRPMVHVVASSHVLAPWKWQDYYPQDWLKQVKPEHCAYSIDVFCPSKPNESLGKFGLNPYPIHSPGELDIAIIHLKQEETALKHMKKLGVDILHLRDPNDMYSRGEQVFFEGFEVAAEDLTDHGDIDGHFSQSESTDEDTRIFFPYTTTGSLKLSSPERFLATTDAPEPLPQGLCGGPVLDTKNRVVGAVEGVVPGNHENKDIAGCGVFIPSFTIRAYLDWAERFMLEKITPLEVFEKVVEIKEGKPSNSETPLDFTQDTDNNGNEVSAKADKVFDEMVESMKKHHTPEEVDAILATIDREKEEVMDIMNKDGGDLDEAVVKVRSRTMEMKRKVMEQVMKEHMEEDKSSTQ